MSAGGRSNPAKLAGSNPQPKRDEVVPYEPAEVEALAVELGAVYGPLVVVAAHTGLRPSEWIALEWRDVDRQEGVLRVERAFSYGQVKAPKTKGSRRRVPLSAGIKKRLRAFPGRFTHDSSSPARAAPTSTSGAGGSASGNPRSEPRGWRRRTGPTT